MNELEEKFYETGVVPVVVLEDAEDAVPLAQALVEGGLLSAEVTFRTAAAEEAMRSIMSEEKKEEQERITLSSDTLRKYFPRSYTPLQMQQTIIKLLEQWQKKQQRRNER